MKLVNINNYFIVKSWYKFQKEKKNILLKKKSQPHGWYRKFEKNKRY